MNVRQPNDLLALLDDDNMQIPVDDNSIEMFEVDTDGITRDSTKQASELIQNLTELYSNEEFLNRHPQIRTRLSSEMEALRIALKMKKTSEVIHDRLAQAIGQCPDNASLYMAFTRIQKSLIDIQNKQDAAVDRINQLLRSYQLELEFNDMDNEDEELDIESSNDSEVTTRGAKAFISQMQKSGVLQTNPADDDAFEVVEEEN